jgi:predicted ATPase
MIPRIRQVQIKNYKSLGRVVVGLEPFTVLVGPNGAGKSNFVDALAFVQESLSHSPGRALKNRGGTRIASRWNREEDFGLRFQIDLAAGSQADYALEIGWQDEYRIARERCCVWEEGRQRAVFEVANGRFVQEIPGVRAQIPQDRLALLAASATDEFRPVYDFLTTLRFYDIDPQPLSLLQGADSGEVLEADGSNAASVLRRLESQEPVRYERVCALLRLATGSVQSVRTVEERERIALEFLQDIGLQSPGMFYGWEMSEGTRRLLALLLALYQPAKSSLIAIEEPEATVHPAMAEAVLQILLDAAQDRQILITTHSPDILDAKELSDGQIRTVTSHHGRTTIAPLSRASRQAIREHLYTPGELLRVNELGQDVEAAEKAAEQLDLFGEVPASTPP